MAGSVRTVSSVQSDTAAAARRPDLTSPATSASSILTEVRTQGKPVMGLRQHIQTRKPRILSQSQLSQSRSGVGVNGNRLQRDSTQSPQISQPISEFSLNFEAKEQAGRLSKASFACDDRVGQLHSSAWSESTSSVPHSCRSGDNNRGSETATAALGGTGGDEAEPQWVRYCVSCCLGATDTGGGGSISPSVGVAQTLLTGLAGAAPYPRLADVAQCSLLACEQREALCARQDAEIAALEASLAEAKATGNQLRCRLSQIEASWGAANRAAELANIALEISGVLVHLYSSELALLLHKQPHTERRPKSRKSLQDRSFGRHPLSRSAFTSSSTSTSSSSSSCSSSEDEPQRSCKAPSASVVPAFCHHVASVKNSIGRQIQPPAATSDSGSNVYALYAMNEKSSDETSHLSIPTWIPPHAVCSGPACLRLLKMQRHQTELTALHLLGRFASTSEPFLKPGSLNCTIAEDFDHSTTNGNRSTATGTESGLGAESGGSSSGMGAHGVYANAWDIATRPAASTRHAFKSGGGDDCGWQTPDSGADSFSTNDHTASTAATKAIASLAVIAGVPNTHTCASCSSNSSSSSAAAGAVVIDSGVGAGVSDAAAVLHDVGVWTRVKEMRLRHILDQIIWERMLVRSTIAVGVNNLEAGCSGVPRDGESHYVKPYTGSEIPAYSEGGPTGVTTQDSRDPAISNRLNALFMVDTAALMRDLCAVKEDRAKLKVQNYIMEKELRAIQLSHQRHCLLESTLRSQLNALQIDRNLQMLKASDRSGIPNPLAQQIESMQSAFESLRKGAELHQTQSEELVNDLKQANAALITAFEKAKSKYLARIRKLESQIVAPSSTLMVSRPASSTAFAPTKHTISTQPPMVPAHKAAHPEPPLPPLSPSPASDVYEVIQDSHAGPVTIRKNPGQPLLNATTSGDATSQNSCYSLVQSAPFYPNQPMPTINRAPPRAR
ncbi:colorectal mutant cancer protein [Echinococcus multilocularis]|uniref:Colorectal mutant cancer protein n=1 Tax=Echinococcus multilocularis TaxID=6211 RepID=A0A068YIM1_ECHMU|nr:colorectal mutant cancer protein [Echinococcus multilocularis]